MILFWEYSKKEAVAAHAVNGPSVEGVRLGPGAGRDLLDRLEPRVLCEVDRGLAIMDMVDGYRWNEQSVGRN